jgi:hypothetical protein
MYNYMWIRYRFVRLRCICLICIIADQTILDIPLVFFSDLMQSDLPVEKDREWTLFIFKFSCLDIRI